MTSKHKSLVLLGLGLGCKDIVAKSVSEYLEKQKSKTCGDVTSAFGKRMGIASGERATLSFRMSRL